MFPLPIEMLKSFINFNKYGTNQNNISTSPITSSPFNSSRYLKRPSRIKQKEITSDSSINETPTVANSNSKNKSINKPKEVLVISQQKSSTYDVTDL